MAAYIILANFTEKGAANIQEASSRIRERMDRAAAGGVSVRAIYFTLGSVDVVAIVEGDEAAVMAGLFALASEGLVRTTTLRAFSLDEVDQILTRAG
ncbi:MAG: hypothetical protein KatS3mg060_2367 [Dehalococcoidia bacterium]|nr:MAG: hypothetical protein KatS3mg060_2367 [Dehalococcoidia bacterium]